MSGTITALTPAGARAALGQLRSQVAGATNMARAVRAVDSGVQTSALLIAGRNGTPYTDEGLRALGLTRHALGTAARRGWDETMRLELLDGMLLRSAQQLRAGNRAAALDAVAEGHRFLGLRMPAAAR